MIDFQNSKLLFFYDTNNFIPTVYGRLLLLCVKETTSCMYGRWFFFGDSIREIILFCFSDSEHALAFRWLQLSYKRLPTVTQKHRKVSLSSLLCKKMFSNIGTGITGRGVSEGKLTNQLLTSKVYKASDFGLRFPQSVRLQIGKIKMRLTLMQSLCDMWVFEFKKKHNAWVFEMKFFCSVRPWITLFLLHQCLNWKIFVLLDF